MSGRPLGTRENAVRAARRLAASAGFDIVRRTRTHAGRRAAALAHHQIDLVLDVGANNGQYVRLLRQFGYVGDVVSFEPIPAIFSALEADRAADDAWTGFPYAIGDADDEMVLNVTADPVMSSMLPPTEGFIDSVPTAASTRLVPVTGRRLDSVWSELSRSNATTMLKIDVQGFEHQVLDGLGERIADVRLVEVEMSLTPLYEAGSSLYDLLPRLTEAGFSAVSLDCGGFDARTGQVFDIDMLLAR